MVKKAFAVFALLVVILVAAAAPSAQPATESPGPEHKALGRFVGNWTIEGKAHPGPMGPGGAFTGTETCRMFEGGFHLVCESKGSGALGNMAGQMLLTWDRAAKTYRFFSVNNRADAEMGTGSLNGNTWTFTSSMHVEGKKISTRFTLVETSPTVHTVTFSMSEDGKKWTTMMEGKSTKQ